MTNLELAKAINVKLFADRGTDIKAAMDYAYELINALDSPAAGHTALHVVLNTVSNIIKENEYENI